MEGCRRRKCGGGVRAGWMDGWQWDVSGQRHKMRTRFKKRFIFPGKKKKVVLHSVAQFLKSASKDLLDGAPRISQNALEKKNSWRWWKEVWRVKLLLGLKVGGGG